MGNWFNKVLQISNLPLGLILPIPNATQRRLRTDSVIKSLLYNSQGKDQEIEIGKILPKLSAQKLLWVDVVGTTDDNSRVSELFSLSPAI